MFEFIKLTSNFSNVIFVELQEDDVNGYNIIAKGNDVQGVFDYIKKLFEHGTCELLFVDSDAGTSQKLPILGLVDETFTIMFSEDNTEILSTFTAPDGNGYVGFHDEK